MKKLDQIDRPELVIGLIAPVGTPLQYFITRLQTVLDGADYTSEVLHLSKYTSFIDGLQTDVPNSDEPFKVRLEKLMNRGNEAREQSKRQDILALMALNEIHKRRRGKPGYANAKSAFILRQMKRPEEVYLLRRTYGDGFHLLGLHCPKAERREYLVKAHGVAEEDLDDLLSRDLNEFTNWGQSVNDAFHLSDVFFDLSDNLKTVEDQLIRFIDLLFGRRVHSPKKDEFGMFQAYAASLRSASLARQVGAALLTKEGDVIAVGVNDVPRADGGLYWPDDPNDRRDHILGYDSSTTMIRETLDELLSVTVDGWEDLAPDEQENRRAETEKKLQHSHLLGLTEFGRAVHAEMEALCSAARMGKEILYSSLYVTTFPCHGCTKHIVSGGIKEVIFIEPYPKSLAEKLHGDSISIEDADKNKVWYRPFIGIAPRCFQDLFSMISEEGKRIRRKDSEGHLIDDQMRIRLRIPYTSSLQREELEVRALDDILPKQNKEEAT